MTTSPLQPVIKERRRELEAAIASGETAVALAAEVESLRSDLRRIEGNRDKLEALGDGHVELPQSSYHQGYGLQIDYEPIRSWSTGKQLAKVLEGRAEHLRGEIAKREKEIENLLAPS